MSGERQAFEPFKIITLRSKYGYIGYLFLSKRPKWIIFKYISPLSIVCLELILEL